MKHCVRNTLIIIVSVLIILVMYNLYTVFTYTDEEALAIINDTSQGDFKITKNKNKTFNIEEHFFDCSEFAKPSGILVEKDKIYIVDSQNNCIFVFDQNGNLLNKIGSTGNGNMQFLEPHQIRFYEDHFYVLDSGNNRIQIFDENFTYYDTKQLNVFEDYSSIDEFAYCDFAIAEGGTIYVSTLAMKSMNTHIFQIDNKGVITQIGDNLVGYLTAVNGTVYFVNHKTVLTATIRGKTGTHYVSYDNFLYVIDNGRLVRVNELPFKYDPVNFTYDENYLYIYSYQFDTLDQYTKQGEYLYTLYEFDEGTKIRYLAYDCKTNRLFASSPETSQVYCLTAKK